MTAQEALQQTNERRRELEEQRDERERRAREHHEYLKAQYRANLAFARQQADKEIEFAIGKGEAVAIVYCGVNEDGAAWSEVLKEALEADSYSVMFSVSKPDRHNSQYRYRLIVRWDG